MPYIPGNAVEGFCDECKKDSVHTVMEVSGMQIRKVRCEKCGAEGVLKMPRHKTRAGLREALSKKEGVKKRRPRKSKEDPGKAFRQLVEGKDLSAARDYNVKLDLNEGDVVRHKRFGIGVVESISDDNKANIYFEDGPKILIFNMQ